MKKIFSLCLTLVFLFNLILSVTICSKSGDVIGYAKYTDISAYINNYPITSYNINGYTAVVAEDLRNYGFSVEWNESDRSLSITRNNNSTEITPYGAVYKYASKAGKNAYPYLETDIVTFVNGIKVKSFNINGNTCVYIDSLAPYGEVSWNPDIRVINLWIEELPSKEYAPLEEAITLYAADGRTVVVGQSDVEAYKAVGWYENPFNISKKEYLEKDWVYEVTRFENDYIDNVGNKDHFCFKVPAFNISSSDAKKVNEEIYSKVYKVIEETIDTMKIGCSLVDYIIDYEYYINGDIVSLVITLYNAWDQTDSIAYNMNKLTGERVSNSQLVSLFGYTDESFIKTLKDVAGKYYMENVNYPKNEYYWERYSFTISDKACNMDVPLYIGENGNLFAAVYIGSVAGAGSYERMLDIGKKYS